MYTYWLLKRGVTLSYLGDSHASPFPSNKYKPWMWSDFWVGKPRNLNRFDFEGRQFKWWVWQKERVVGQIASFPCHLLKPNHRVGWHLVLFKDQITKYGNKHTPHTASLFGLNPFLRHKTNFPMGSTFDLSCLSRVPLLFQDFAPPTEESGNHFYPLISYPFFFIENIDVFPSKEEGLIMVPKSSCLSTLGST